MENLLLAVGVIAATLIWRRSEFRVPNRIPLSVTQRARLLLAGGCLTIFLTTGYSAGDLIAGRTQVSERPVRYATRLQPPDAHIHDIGDAGRYWWQITRQLAMGLLVGGVLIAASRDAGRLGGVRLPSSGLDQAS